MSAPAPASVPLTAEQAQQLLAQLQHAQQQLQHQQQALQQLQQQHVQLQQQQQQSVSSLKPPKIPTFEGVMGFEVDTWMREVKKHFEWYGHNKFPNDAAKIKYAAVHFGGAALDWWDAVDKSEMGNWTWNDFERLLHERYRPKLAAEVAREQLARIQQKGNQSVQSLCNTFQRYVAHVPTMHEEDKIFQFKRALHPLIAAKVAESKPATLMEAMHAAVQAEIYLGKRQGTGGSSYGGSYNSRAPSFSGAAPMDLNIVEAAEAKYPEPNLPAVSTPFPATDAPLSDPAVNMIASKLEAMEHRLNAMYQKGRQGGDRRGANNRNRDRIPGLTKEDIERLRAEDRCFRCKKVGHMKNECPQARLN